MMENLFWIFDNRTQHWESVKVLALGYKKFYRSKGKLRAISVKASLNRKFSHQDIIVFGNDQVSVENQIELIRRTPENIRILSHLYGDIVHQLRTWSKAKELLEKRRFSFIVGSTVSQKISNLLLKKPATVIPFNPVIEKNKASKVNHKIGKTIQFYYAGRISYFKNVHVLIEYFVDYWLKGRLVELHIYGKPDNYRYPGFKIRSDIQDASILFHAALDRARNLGAPIYYHGFLEKKLLRNAILHHDIFTTLTTAPEEDYSLAAQQAILMKQVLSTTFWGGLQRFKDLKNVSFIPVRILKHEIKIDKNQVLRSWDKARSLIKLATGEREPQHSLEKLLKTNQKVVLSFNKIQKFSGFRSLAFKPVKPRDFFLESSRLTAPLWKE